MNLTNFLLTFLLSVDFDYLLVKKKLKEKGNCVSAVIEQQQSYEIPPHHTIDSLCSRQQIVWDGKLLCARYIYSTQNEKHNQKCLQSCMNER